MAGAMRAGAATRQLLCCNSRCCDVRCESFTQALHGKSYRGHSSCGQQIQFAQFQPEFHPLVAKSLQNGYASQWPQIASSLKVPAALGLRINLSAVSREDMSRELAQHGVATHPHADMKDMLVADLKPAPVVRSDCNREEGLADCQGEVVVGRLCGEAVLNGAHVFVPGVLSCSKNIKPGQTVQVSSDIDDLDLVGTDPGKLRGRRVVIGQGIVSHARKDMLARRVGGVAVEMLGRAVDVPPAMNGLVPPGRVYCQGLAPAAVGHLLDPSSHRAVVDLCAAPGGKASHVAARLYEETGFGGEECVVVACDRSKRRLSILRQLAIEWRQDRMMHFVHGDSRILPSSDGLTPAALMRAGFNAAGEVRSKGLKTGAWDAVLVDPPCSSLGLRPRLGHKKLTLQAVERLVIGQRRMLRVADSLLKPGGVAIYSTCTIMPEENEEVVAWALGNLAFQLTDASQALGGPGWRGHGLQQNNLQLCRRTDPVGDTAGFFVAVLRKTR